MCRNAKALATGYPVHHGLSEGPVLIQRRTRVRARHAMRYGVCKAPAAQPTRLPSETADPPLTAEPCLDAVLPTPPLTEAKGALT